MQTFRTWAMVALFCALIGMIGTGTYLTITLLFTRVME